MGQLSELNEALARMQTRAMPQTTQEAPMEPPVPDFDPMTLVKAVDTISKQIAKMKPPELEVEIDVMAAAKELVKALNAIRYPEINLDPITQAIAAIKMPEHPEMPTMPEFPEYPEAGPVTFKVYRDESGLISSIVATPGDSAPADTVNYE